MPEPTVFPATPFAGLGGRIVPAAFPFFTTGEDNLRIVSYNRAAGVTIALVGRLIDLKGRPSPDTWTHTPNTDGTAKADDFPLSGLTLLNLRAVVAAGALKFGDCYIEVQVIRGLGLGATVLGTVLAGYLTATSALGWPGSPIASTLSGPGANTGQKINLGAFGGEWSVVVPAGVRWEVIGIYQKLATSGVPATRAPLLQVFVGGFLAFEVPSNQTTPAGVAMNYTWAPGLPSTMAVALVTHTMSPFPQGLILGAGDSVGSLTLNLDAGDRWGTGFITYRQWLEP